MQEDDELQYHANVPQTHRRTQSDIPKTFQRALAPDLPAKTKRDHVCGDGAYDLTHEFGNEYIQSSPAGSSPLLGHPSVEHVRNSQASPDNSMLEERLVRMEQILLSCSDLDFFMLLGTYNKLHLS